MLYAFIIETDYGPAVIDHVLQTVGLSDVRLADAVIVEVVDETPAEQKPSGKNKKGKVEKPKKVTEKNHRVFDFEKDLPLLMKALEEAEEMINRAKNGQSKVNVII